jgi:hypothetical protein
MEELDYKKMWTSIMDELKESFYNESIHSMSATAIFIEMQTLEYDEIQKQVEAMIKKHESQEGRK